MTATDHPRRLVIAGVILIAVGITRLILGIYVPLGVLLIGLGLVTILLPLWRRRRGV